MSAEPRVLLNVGGRRFEAYQSTLTRGAARDSLFARLLAPENRAMCKPDADGCFFFDRNPDIFSLLLDYLRGGSLSLPACSHYSQAAVRAEAEYFGIELKKGEPKQEPMLDTILDDSTVSRVKDAEKAVMDRIDERMKELMECSWKLEFCTSCTEGAYWVKVQVPVPKMPALEMELLDSLLTEVLTARGVGDVYLEHDVDGTVYTKLQIPVHMQELQKRIRQ